MSARGTTYWLNLTQHNPANLAVKPTHLITLDEIPGSKAKRTAQACVDEALARVSAENYPTHADVTRASQAIAKAVKPFVNWWIGQHDLAELYVLIDGPAWLVAQLAATLSGQHLYVAVPRPTKNGNLTPSVIMMP